MTNKYYRPGETRAEKVGDLFATIAPRYDLINDLQSFGLHRLWKKRLVRMANPQAGERALDLCCGTGDVAFALARRGVEVLGLDFSEPMLELARRRGVRAGVEPGGGAGRGPQFLRGDAQQVPLAGNSFDIVIVSYGLRNLADWRRGLEEMLRVARTGGRLLVLDFGKPDLGAWRALYFGYLRACVPLFGRAFCGDSETYSYILESLLHYPAQHAVAAAMREIGCRDVRLVSLFGGVMTINYGVRP